jgi:hypothetical protein
MRRGGTRGADNGNDDDDDDEEANVGVSNLRYEKTT